VANSRLGLGLKPHLPANVIWKHRFTALKRAVLTHRAALLLSLLRRVNLEVRRCWCDRPPCTDWASVVYYHHDSLSGFSRTRRFRITNSTNGRISRTLPVGVYQIRAVRPFVTFVFQNCPPTNHHKGNLSPNPNVYRAENHSDLRGFARGFRLVEARA